MSQKTQDKLPKPGPESQQSGVFVLSEDEHNISRSRLTRNTAKVLAKLAEAGFEAQMVGGSVRDLLLGYEPKDFDIATDARPEQVKGLFNNARIIGRRFRLVHVYFHREMIEVATYRGDPHHQDRSEGMIVRDNVYGDVEDDAWRRDFTINALYYDYVSGDVLDYTGGLYDLYHGIIRLIGDVRRRYHEDPVRMLRAVRLAVKLGFDIEQDTSGPIPELAGLMQNVPPARRLHEINKLFLEGYAAALFPKLRQYGLFAVLFPHTEAMIGTDGPHHWLQLVELTLESTDRRIKEGKPVSPGFLLAALLWPPLQYQLDHLQATGMALFPALTLAIRKVIQNQRVHVSLPQRYVMMMREVWTLQYRMLRSCNQKAWKLVGHPRLRAALDFLALRQQAGDIEGESVQWWRDFMDADWSERETMIQHSQSQAKAKGKSSGKKRKKRN